MSALKILRPGITCTGVWTGPTGGWSGAKQKNARLNQLPDAVNPHQMLWGINQGGTYGDIRVEHMKRIADLDLPGYAIGGLAVGESTEVMYEIIETVEPYMPREKTRYLMGGRDPQQHH